MPLRSITSNWLFFSIYQQWDVVEELPHDPSDQDAFAVLEALFFLAIHHRFGQEQQKRQITAFAEQVAQNWASEEGLKPEEVSTLIARSLAGSPSTDILDHHAMLLCYFHVAQQVVLESRFDVDAVVDLIRRAEKLAMRRGFSPTPYRVSEGKDGAT